MPKPRAEQISIADTPITTLYHAVCGALFFAEKIAKAGAATNTGAAGLRIVCACWPRFLL